MRTKIFGDIADLKTIKVFNKKKIVNGFTTNPSLMRLAGAKNYKKYCLKILKICKSKSISFEVFADEPKEMLRQAILISKWGKNVYVKIPVVNSKGKLDIELRIGIGKGYVPSEANDMPNLSFLDIKNTKDDQLVVTRIYI